MQTKTKTFDCVKMKHEIQAKIFEETKDMTPDQLREYFKHGAEEFRQQIAARTDKPSLGEFLDSLKEAAAKNAKN